MSAATAVAIDNEQTNAAAELARLRNFIPLHRLSDSEFDLMMQSASVETMRAGRNLFEAGVDERWMFYLLDGSIEIFESNGSSFSLSGNTIEACHPLSAKKSVHCRAQALTDIHYVRLPCELLKLANSDANSGSVEVEEIAESDDDADKRIVFNVYHQLMDDSFALPTFPDIAMRVRAVANDPDSSADDLTRVIQSDPSIAAHCIRLANSAAYSSAVPVSEVREAVVRMGVTTTADLVTVYAMSTLFAAPNRTIGEHMQRAWHHSTRVAIRAYAIAASVSTLNPEKALLAGLLHDVGMLIIIREWCSQNERPLKPEVLNTLARELNASLGSMVLRNWSLSEPIVKATLEPEHWARFDHDIVDVCDCVTLAHAYDDSPAPWSLPIPDAEHIAAISRLPDPSLNNDGIPNIVVNAFEQLELLSQLFEA